MTTGVDLTRVGAVARIRINRPEARNAMTFAMYEALLAALNTVRADASLRVLVLEGDQRAFVAGTEISEFLAFRSGEDGIAYESFVERVLTALETLPVPTLAAVKGVATGGGLMLAIACDLRLVSSRARIGAPIARTVGNCLSARNLARLQNVVGPTLTRRMLFAAELVDAAVCERSGFSTWTADAVSFDTVLEEKLEAIASGAPLTHVATKAALIGIASGDLQDSDIVAGVYGSQDFKEGVEAFTSRRSPSWQGN